MNPETVTNESKVTVVLPKKNSVTENFGKNSLVIAESISKKSWAVNIILLFVGLTFLLASLLWTPFLSQNFIRLDNNLKLSANIISKDNFYDLGKDDFASEQLSNSKFEYSVEKTEGNNIRIRNTFQVIKPNGEKIFSGQRRYLVDSETGEHVDENGKKIRDNYLFGPIGLTPKPFTFWHAAYNVPIHMSFSKSEILGGSLRTNKYVANFVSDQTEDYKDLPGVPDKIGIRAEGELIVWIEPETGSLVKWEDMATNYYYDQTTKRNLYPKNKFHNVFSDFSARDFIQKAETKKETFRVVRFAIPVVFFIISALLILVFLFNSRNFVSKGGVRHSRKDKIVDYLITVAISSSIFFLGAIIAVILYWQMDQELAKKKTERVSLVTSQITDQISKRLEIYENALIATASFLHTNPNFNQASWREFVTRMDVQKRYPGIQAIGYAKYLTSAEKKAFEEKQRLYNPSFRIFPQTSLPISTPVVYLEPENDVNNQAIGFDLFSEEVRKQAISRSIANKQTQLSGKIVLIQDQHSDNHEYGFLMFAPIFSDQVGATTNPKKVDGFAFAPLRVGDFLTGVLGETDSSVDFAIFDGSVNVFTEDKKLFDTKKDRNFDQIKNSDSDSWIRSVVFLQMVNYPWTINFTISKTVSLGFVEDNFPKIVLFGGLAISCLMSSIVYLFIAAKKRAEGLAEKMTANLQQKIKEIDQVKDELQASNQKLIDSQNEIFSKMTQLEKTNGSLENTKSAVLNILEDLKETSIKNEQQTDLLNSLLKNLPIGVMLVDAIKKIPILLNPKGWELLNKDIEGVSTGMAYSQFFNLYTSSVRDPQLYPENELPLTQTFRTGEPALKDDILIRRPQMSAVQIRAATAPVCDHGGNLIYVVVVFEDITKEKNIDRMKTEFISLASHQLRTPLSAIKWFTEMLLAGDAGKLTAEQTSFARNVSDSTNRMIDLVNSLLNVSRIESGRIIIDPVPTNLRALLEKIKSDLQNKLAEKETHLDLFVNDDVPIINFDPKLIREVFLNLLSNAIKYTAKNGQIQVKISKSDSSVLAQISDNGYGIPADEQQKIFDKFFRASNVIKIDPDGNGLGLYLVKAIVESSGGKIWFNSEENHGTTFFFTLPLSGVTAQKGEVSLTESSKLV